jgi:hypothetical protein
MRRSWCLLLAVSGLVAASPAVLPDGSDELERNRRLLERWKADPEHIERLENDLAAFYRLPPARQEQLRRLDRALHERGDLSSQNRLWGVLERYVSWLKKLPEGERRRILEAPSSESKLAIIRELRQRDWVARLPRKLRDEVMKLPPEQQAVRVRALRQEERQQRAVWQRPLGAGNGPILKPASMEELPKEAREFFNAEVRPRLSSAEKIELREADRKWPAFPRLVARLAERHPVLPPGPKGKIVTMKELHQRHPRLGEVVDQALARGKGKGKAKDKGGGRAFPKGNPAHLEGKWPEFALAVTAVVPRRLHPLHPLPPLGAARIDDFPEPIRTFLRNELLKALTQMEREGLKDLEGRWPEYPKELLRLAREKQLVIPGMSLPGPPEMWEHARVALLEAPAEPLSLVATDLPRGFGRFGRR